MSRNRALLPALLALAVVPAGSTAATPEPPLPYWTHRACAYEDSVNCYWDAGSAGNGGGHSFALRRFPDGPTCVMYVERRYARHHDRCG